MIVNLPGFLLGDNKGSSRLLSFLGWIIAMCKPTHHSNHLTLWTIHVAEFCQLPSQDRFESYFGKIYRLLNN
jgi:hypothetical protein